MSLRWRPFWLFAFCCSVSADAKTSRRALRLRTFPSHFIKLKPQLATVESQNKKLLDEVSGVQEKLAKQINDRIDQVSEQMMMKSKELLDKVSKDAESTRQAASTVVASARGDYDKELSGVKAAFAGDLQKLREEQKATFEELKKYMDNQLKELYPYAYQPRRTGDTKAPPEN